MVHPKAELGEGVEVGPFSVIEAGARIGDRTVIEGHCVVKSSVQLGEDCVVAHGALLGGDPQYRGFDRTKQTYLEIGRRTTLREYVTIHRSIHEGGKTLLGDDCYIMAFTHVGHDGTVGSGVTIANGVNLAGHVTVEELATIGGMTGIHQFARIGKAAMVQGMSGISRDVPPFTITAERDRIVDINAVGLRRLGIPVEKRTALHKAVKILFKSQLNLSNAIAAVRRELPMTEEIEYLLAFEERRFRGRHGRGDQP